jgi:2,4-dienoyl-CoA reductase-like NADH-dependent reductase (Old Yellow Enzyme family)
VISKKQTFFLAVNTGFVQNALPDRECLEFYKARSGKGIGCTIIGNVVISGGYGTNDVCAEISEDSIWCELASVILKNGSIPGIQLSSTWPNYIGNKSFVSNINDKPIDEYKLSILNLNLKEVELIIANLKKSIELSIKAGFTHIQIHAAHGYLFSLLLDPTFSKYSELFLNSLAEIVENLKNRNIQSSIRFSLLSGSQKLDKERGDVIERIVNLDFDFFDVSFGFYNINKHLIYPESDSALKSRRIKTLYLASRFPSKNFIISGKIKKEELLGFPYNVYWGLCRDLIANPSFLLQHDDGCKNFGMCHYFSNSTPRLKCGNWEVR